MRFYSGFGFRNDKLLFLEYLDRGKFCIAGFSFGTQKALLDALQTITEGGRVEKLQLFSPAFFNYLPKELKNKEIIAYAKNQELYMRFFYKKASYPAMMDLEKFQSKPTLGELKELLFFEWKCEDLESLKRSGVEIEVYLGEQDKIIDSKKAKEFFIQYATVYMIKDVGHLLKGRDE
ncbi:pimelyl-ACP methyl ester esterase BioV [Nitratiruptor sp. YY09-18]|uniref:pimelyl-ACP methyl ester esterase BioV n=1 Tax=Nitratiruptor sp. YY09-18 TaxID=2724901 RepID=UPI001916C236|nr:pimelyl-ACP methyl ester esterase BioV [Nitratiruptor sp. YY09-18]BCD68279.1 hypothetical protein NitYY0918_C1190 [Nitratiruptor sp. YY09-18]